MIGDGAVVRRSVNDRAKVTVTITSLLRQTLRVGVGVASAQAEALPWHYGAATANDSETLPDRFRKRTLRERDVLEWFQAQGDRADLQMALALKIYAEANKAYSLD